MASPIDDIAARAGALGIRPWIAIKEALAGRIIEVMATDGRAVLQGGAALHFAYGSPRLSADVDFVGDAVAPGLAERGEEMARAASDLLGRPATWSLVRAGRLSRGKVSVALDGPRRLVLPVEAYEVPAHRPVAREGLGIVEEAVEIAADKIVASAARWAARGTLKTTDVYDLWYLVARVGAPPPDVTLVEEKAADYGEAPRGADLAAAARSVPAPELLSALTGILPSSELVDLDARDIIETAAALLGRYSHVL